MRALLRPALSAPRIFSTRSFARIASQSKHAFVTYTNEPVNHVQDVSVSTITSDEPVESVIPQPINESADDAVAQAVDESSFAQPRDRSVGLYLQLVRDSPDVASVWKLISASDAPLMGVQITVIFSKLSQPKFCSHRQLYDPVFERLCSETIVLVPTMRITTLRGLTGSIGRLYAEFAYGTQPRANIHRSLVKLVHALVDETLKREASIITDIDASLITFRQLARMRREYKKNKAFWELMLKLASQIDNRANEIPINRLVPVTSTFLELNSLIHEPGFDGSKRVTMLLLRHQTMIKIAERLCHNPDLFNELTDYAFAQLLVTFVDLKIRYQDNFFAVCCTRICAMTQIRVKAARDFVLALSKAGIYHRGVYRHLAREITASPQILSFPGPHADATHILHSYMRILSWSHSADIIPLFEAICLKLSEIKSPFNESILYRVHRLWALAAFNYQHHNSSAPVVKQCITDTTAQITMSSLESGVPDHCWLMLQECMIMNPTLFDYDMRQLIASQHAKIVRAFSHRHSNHMSALEWLRFLQPCDEYDTDLQNDEDLILAPRNTVAVRKSDGAYVVLLYSRAFFLHEYEIYRQLAHEHVLGCQLAQERRRNVLFIQRDFSVANENAKSGNRYQFYDASTQDTLVDESLPEVSPSPQPVQSKKPISAKSSTKHQSKSSSRSKTIKDVFKPAAVDVVSSAGEVSTP